MLLVDNHVHKAYNVLMETIQCVQCGEDAIQKTAKPRKFCSGKCAQKYFRLLDPERHRAYWKKYYDSKPEWHINRTREYEAERPEWQRATNLRATRRYKEKTRHGNHKQFLIDKYGGCENCGTKDVLQIHHIDRVSFHNSPEPNNSLDNLRLLCQTCHLKLHHKEGFRKTEAKPHLIINKGEYKLKP